MPASLPAIGLCMAMFTGPLAPPGPAGPSQRTDPASAPVLRDLALTDIDGRRWTMDRLQGRVVLLDFWATWCAPCLEELPALRALAGRYRGDLQIIGINMDVMSRRDLVSWLNRNRIDWPQVHDRRGYSSDTAIRFGVDRLPMTILVDPSGRVAATGLRGAELASAVHKLAAGISRSSGKIAGR